MNNSTIEWSKKKPIDILSDPDINMFQDGVCKAHGISVLFGSDCPECRALQRKKVALASEYNSRIRYAKMEVDSVYNRWVTSILTGKITPIE